jgi:hypothetical protein
MIIVIKVNLIVKNKLKLKYFKKIRKKKKKMIKNKIFN